MVTKGKAPSPLRDAILSAVDIQEEVVTIKEWGGIKVLCRGMSGRERSAYFVGNEDREMWEYTPRLILGNVLDPDTREPIFEAEDIDALADKSGVALDRLAKTITRLSGFGEEAKEEMEAVTEAFQ